MASKSRLIALNAGLAVGLGLLAWQARVKWSDAQAQRKATVNIPVKKVTPPPITPSPKPEAVQAAKYVDVAAKNLFSKDRNPTVVVEPPKVEAPKVMPPLPVVFGVLTLSSGTRAIMADHAGGTSKTVVAGDTIGDFKVLALDARKVTFEWDGKKIERSVDDLAAHGASPAAAGAPVAGPAAPPPPSPVASGPPTPASLGAEINTPDGPARACKPGDGSPSGTVVDGYKKRVIDTPFGPMGCSWVPNK